ncbi:hypothetical protein GC173_18985 [bacterium]|nr:hypothetical protein [bacterium]
MTHSSHAKNAEPDAGGVTSPGFSRPVTDDEWETCRALIPCDEIGYLVAIFEAYENEFLVRTEQRGMGLVRIWYPKIFRPTLDRVFNEFRADFPVDVLGFSPGMDGLDEVYPD